MTFKLLLNSSHITISGWHFKGGVDNPFDFQNLGIKLVSALFTSDAPEIVTIKLLNILQCFMKYSDVSLFSHWTSSFLSLE